MNKVTGLLKIIKIIKENKNRNMSIMDTEKDVEVLGSKEKANNMEYFDNYIEFKNIIENMKDNDKKIFLSIAPESDMQSYFDFDYVKPEDMLMYFNKENGKTKCTFNKKSLRLRRGKNEKRIGR